MLVFLALVGFVALILYRQIATAFMANPGLNALIIGVMLIGIVLALRQVWRLFSEVRWVNTLHRGDASSGRQPVLLAPMARLIGERGGRPISTHMLRAILDSVGSRLDEAREISRYLTGLLVFLGLLGTFWGLLETLGSIGARHQFDAGRLRHDGDVRRFEGGPFRAARGHGDLVHVVALRPRGFARPGLPRSAGGAGAEPLLHRA